MNYSAPKPGAGNRLGDWGRLIYLLGIAGSIAAAASFTKQSAITLWI